MSQNYPLFVTFAASLSHSLARLWNASNSLSDLNEQISIKLYKSVAEDNEERVYDDWHASAMAECPRAHYFKRLGIKPLNKPTGAKILRWDAGHSIEGVIRPHIKKLFKGIVPNERMTSKKLHLTGEFDNYSEEEATLVEIKSVSDYAFYSKDGVTALKEQVGEWPNGSKKWGLKVNPYLNHAIQQHSYKLLLDELKKPLKRIVYVYISLNGRIVVYDTVPNEHITTNVLSRLKVLNEAWEKQEPPECICDNTEHPLYAGVMQYCQYKRDNDCCSLELIK